MTGGPQNPRPGDGGKWILFYAFAAMFVLAVFLWATGAV